MLRLLLHEDAVETLTPRSFAHGTAAREGIEDHATGGRDVTHQVGHQRNRLDRWMLGACAIVLVRLAVIDQRIGVGAELMEETGSRAGVAAHRSGSPTIELAVAVRVVVTRARRFVAFDCALLSFAVRKQRNDLGRAVEDQVGGVTAFRWSSFAFT